MKDSTSADAQQRLRPTLYMVLSFLVKDSREKWKGTIFDLFKQTNSWRINDDSFSVVSFLIDALLMRC